MPTSKPLTLAIRLRELREWRGLTANALAVRAGLRGGSNTVSRIESGERSPTWETVVALATALGVSTEEFR